MTTRCSLIASSRVATASRAVIEAEVAGAARGGAAVDAVHRVAEEAEGDEREHVGHVLQHVRRRLRHHHHGAAHARPSPRARPSAVVKDPIGQHDVDDEREGEAGRERVAGTASAARPATKATNQTIATVQTTVAGKNAHFMTATCESMSRIDVEGEHRERGHGRRERRRPRRRCARGRAAAGRSRRGRASGRRGCRSPRPRPSALRQVHSPSLPSRSRGAPPPTDSALPGAATLGHSQIASFECPLRLLSRSSQAQRLWCPVNGTDMILRMLGRGAS